MISYPTIQSGSVSVSVVPSATLNVSPFGGVLGSAELYNNGCPSGVARSAGSDHHLITPCLLRLAVRPLGHDNQPIERKSYEWNNLQSDKYQYHDCDDGE